MRCDLQDHGTGIAVDDADNVVAAGIFAKGIDFGGGSMSGAGGGGFIVKFAP